MCKRSWIRFATNCAQSQENLREAARAQSRIRTASAIFLAVFAIIAALIVIQVYLQARAWDRDASRAVAEVEAVAAQLEVLRDTRAEARSALPWIAAGSGRAAPELSGRGQRLCSARAGDHR